MKTLSILGCLIFLASCVDRVAPSETSQEGDATVELLFEKNGCKMYRFRDAGHFVYWSDCTGETYQSYTVPHGKTHVTREYQSITTNNNETR